jgi:hypothetical protein
MYTAICVYISLENSNREGGNKSGELTYEKFVFAVLSQWLAVGPQLENLEYYEATGSVWECLQSTFRVKIRGDAVDPVPFCGVNGS